MKIETLSDQPTAVKHRLHHFIRSFIEAVVIVILVALLLMDWRSALVVATAIPLTVAMTLGGMHLCGIQLHQISIAALIIALGMLVDDPVVASDAINRELHHGAAAPARRVARAVPDAARHPLRHGHQHRRLPAADAAAGRHRRVRLRHPGGRDDGADRVAHCLDDVHSAARLSTCCAARKGLEEGGEVRRFFLFRWIDLGLRAVLAALSRRLSKRALRRPWLDHRVHLHACSFSALA